jgi:hypothetical protein
MSADPLPGLHDDLGVLGVALAQWDARDTAAGGAAARRAGSMAVDAIDSMLRSLYLVRGRLLRELSTADAAAAARVNALLEQERK